MIPTMGGRSNSEYDPCCRRLKRAARTADTRSNHSPSGMQPTASTATFWCCLIGNHLEVFVLETRIPVGGLQWFDNLAINNLL